MDKSTLVKATKAEFSYVISDVPSHLRTINKFFHIAHKVKVLHKRINKMERGKNEIMTDLKPIARSIDLLNGLMANS